MSKSRTKSHKTKRPANPAYAEYDEHLTRAEDHLEATAKRADSSFRKHTAGADVKLGKAEDELEAAAQRSDSSFRKHTAGADAKLGKAEDKLEAAARRVDEPAGD